MGDFTVKLPGLVALRILGSFSFSNTIVYNDSLIDVKKEKYLFTCLKRIVCLS